MLNPYSRLRFSPWLPIAGRGILVLSWLFLFAVFSATTSFAQTNSAPGHLGCQPMQVARVLTEVDDTARTTLRGNVHRLALAQYDQGRVDDGLLMEHIIMMLKRTPDQEQALTTRIDQMHNTHSPYFHQWLRAEEVGGCYGVADSDIAAVTGWLEKHGFQVDSIPAGKMLIMFTGTAGQVREAFQTEIHNLNVRGEKHIANMSEPTIPKALAPVIAGFHSLNNFFPKKQIHVNGAVRRDSKTGKWQLVEANAAGDTPQSPGKHQAPQITYPTGSSSPDVYIVGPQDFYTIYNENPLLTAKTPINGAGQTLAIVQDDDMTPADVTTFRSQFGLPAYPTTPNAAQGGVNYMFGISGYCSDPGLQFPEDEASTDVEWIGVTAPAATIDFVSCADTATTFGGDPAALYIVNNLESTVSAFSASFGWCEANETQLGLGTPQFYVALWEQAVAEGQTPVVSTGDTGDNACDRGNGLGPNGQDISVSGLSVNGMGSTPYNVAAGGTMFTDSYQTDTFNSPYTTTYWNNNDTTPYGSALSYIPETAWNDYCGEPLLADFLKHYDSWGDGTMENVCNHLEVNGVPLPYTNLGGGAGGISSVSSLPTWQSAYGVGLSTNYTSATMRNLPDVSLFASDYNWWLRALIYCESDIATCDYTNSSDAVGLAAGGTSFVAPMVAGIIGLINQASPSGNPAQPTRQGQPNYTFYALATAEYGTASSQNTSTTAPSTYTCEGSNINAISTYSSIFPSCTFYSINRTNQAGSTTCLGSNDAGCITGSNVQPCETGSANCYTATSGDPYGLLSASTSTFEPAYTNSAGYNDATGLGSFNIANLVNNWTKVTPQFASTTTAAANPTSLTSGTATTTLTATVTATGRGGIAPPLGTVTFYEGTSCTGTALGTAANLVPATNCTTSCNSSATLTGVTGDQLGNGTDSVVACFSGDGANDAPSTSPAATITVTGAVFATTTTENITGTPSSTQSNFGSSVTFTATVAHSSGSAAPTGTVTFVNGTNTLGSGPLNSGTATYTTSSLALGSYSVVAKYSGDNNYAASSSTVATLNVVNFTIAASPTTVTVSAPGQSGQTTLTITPESGFNETLTYSCSGLPSESTCTFATASATTETLTIQTTAASSSQLDRDPLGRNHRFFYALFLPGLLGIVAMGGTRRKARLGLLLLVLMLTILWLPACGGGSSSSTTPPPNTGTPTGTSTVTVTATTGSGAGALTNTVQVTLTVQ